MYSPRPPPPVEQDIPLLLRHPLPQPPRFCALLPAASPPPTPAILWLSNCACGPGRKENPPPVEQDGFPFCHTHTHTRTHTHTHRHRVFVNVWPFYLPTPLLCNRTVFPFALRHTHTHTPCVCVSLRTCSSAKPPFHSLVWGQATYDTGCGTPVMGVVQASRLQALVFGGGLPFGGGGGGGAENAQRNVSSASHASSKQSYVIRTS